MSPPTTQVSKEWSPPHLGALCSPGSVSFQSEQQAGADGAKCFSLQSFATSQHVSSLRSAALESTGSREEQLSHDFPEKHVWGTFNAFSLPRASTHHQTALTELTAESPPLLAGSHRTLRLDAILEASSLTCQFLR